MFTDRYKYTYLSASSNESVDKYELGPTCLTANTAYHYLERKEEPDQQYVLDLRKMPYREGCWAIHFIWAAPNSGTTHTTAKIISLDGTRTTSTG